MSILINLIILLIVLGLLWWLVSLLPIPAPFNQIIMVLFILIAILAVLSLTGIVPGFHSLRL